MTSREALEELKFQVGNITYFTHDLQATTIKVRDSDLFEIIEKDLEIFDELETLKDYYPPFREFLEEMFKRKHNEDLTKIKEWLENE